MRALMASGSCRIASRCGCGWRSTHPGHRPCGCMTTAPTWRGSSSTSATGTGRGSPTSSATNSATSLPTAGNRTRSRPFPASGSRRRWWKPCRFGASGGWREAGSRNPPFAGDNAFGDALARYRENIIKSYTALADEQGLTQAAGTWFTLHRREIEAGGLIPYGQAASLTALAEYESAPGCIEALGALNRWKGRSGLPIGSTSINGR